MTDSFSSAIMRPRRRVATLLVSLAVVSIAATGCGDDDDDSAAADTTVSETTATTTPPSDDYSGGGGEPSGDATVTASDFSFSALTVGPGAEVTFENADGVPHTMTADDGGFDTGRVAGGASATITAPDEPGAHAFHCEIHPSMTATLTVEG